MNDYLGIVCHQCAAFNPMGTASCEHCSSALQGVGGGASGVVEDSMEQARNFICQQCSNPVPSGHKFCGTCGAPVPDAVKSAGTSYFSPVQDEAKARLVLVRGEGGVEGLTYVVASDYIAGRDEGEIVFPDDRFVSPRHASFRYEGETLHVYDEGSINGVFIRLRAPAVLRAGETFRAGEQLFRVEPMPPEEEMRAPDGTMFYGSPARPGHFRIVQILEGGVDGLVFTSREPSCIIGREDSDLNFAVDIYMSRQHTRVSIQPDGTFLIEDLESRNGTYTRIASSLALEDGDYLFLGRELLRVELNHA